MLVDDGHIGRVAVLADYRQNGVGFAIMKTLLEEAKNRGLERVYLGSQVHASNFYKKLGFKVCSDIFIEANIEHIEMELCLS